MQFPKGLVIGMSLVLLAVEGAWGQRVGDEWTPRRGDLTPGLQYTALTQTGSGRLIAVGRGGALMISDDGGTNWTFDRIEVGGRAITGVVTDIEGFGGPAGVVALMIEVVDSSGGRFPFAVRTSLLRSADNGRTWTSQVFPFESAQFLGTTFYGVNLTGLHKTPGGILLAYGTTTVTSNFIVYWSVGGLIYRSNDGSTWTEAKFAFGPLSKIADAGGRLVATGLSTALDSADGAGWNGYTMSSASVATPDGTQLPFETRRALWLQDVAVVGGNYVAQAVQFIPKDGFISTSRIDALYTLVSPSPFDGARAWTAYEQPRLYGNSFATGGGLVGVGVGAYRSANFGQSWTLADATVIAPEGATVQTGPSTLVTVGSSNAAWRSTNGGSSWTKIWSPPVGPNLRMVGTFFGTLFATTNNEIWTSLDNGLTWQLRAAGQNGFGMEQVGNRLILGGAGASSVRVSDDQGFTWQTRIVGGNSSATAFLFTRTPSGRLILAAEGRSVQNEGAFFVSDDGGDTWSARNSGLPFGETPGAIVTSARGVIIASSNSFATFNPQLIISRDNGETWTKSTVLQSLEGLNSVTGDPSTKTIEVTRARASATGRVLLLGENEILTSDDDGVSWAVRLNLDLNQTEVGFFDWELWDLVRTGSRWVAIGSYDPPTIGRQTTLFAMTSDDDGTTWKRVILPVRQSNTVFQSLAVGLDGRVLAGGTNAAVYSTDALAPVPVESPVVAVREGTTGQIEIARPPLPGTIEVTYGAIAGTALAGRDYVATSGVLTWDAADEAPKTVALETIDNALRDGNRELAFSLTFETTDVKGQNEIAIRIEDDDGRGTAGIQLDGEPVLYTSEQGDAATLKIALESQPTADVTVTVTVTGLDPAEGALSSDSFVFTAANWNVQQALIITGIDDPEPDGDRSYELRLKSSSSDAAYNALLEIVVPVVNTGDEPFDSGAEPPPPTPSPTPNPPAIGSVPAALQAPRKVEGKRGKAKIKGTLSGDIVQIEVKAGRGGFKRAKIRGNRFIFTAKGLPDRSKIVAKVKATTAENQQIVEKVKILFKPER